MCWLNSVMVAIWSALKQPITPELPATHLCNDVGVAGDGGKGNPGGGQGLTGSWPGQRH